MSTHIILLRAVNLGGIAKVPMPEFCSALSALGFDDVKSYITSGNIILQSDLSAEDIRGKVDQLLNEVFNISGQRTIVRTPQDLDRLIKRNPFPEAALSRTSQLHVHFMAQAPQVNAELALTSYKGQERLRLDGSHLFIDYIHGAGESKLTTRFLEQALGTTGTARNWNTVLKMFEFVKS